MTGKKKATTLFQEAEEAIDGGASKQCAELIDALEDRAGEWKEEAARIRPPRDTSYFDRGLQQSREGRVQGGPAYRAASVEGDEEELMKLRVRHDVLTQRITHAADLIQQLREREKEARREEEIAAAPERIAELVEELPERLDRLESALEEVRAARKAVEEPVEELPRLRELIDDDSPVLGPETLYRWGRLLNVHLVQRDSWQERTEHGQREPHAVLFGRPGAGEKLMDLLGPADRGIFDALAERVKGLFGAAGSPRSDQATERAIRKARYRTLARGDLDAVEDAEELSARVLEQEAPPGRRRRQVRKAMEA